MISILLYLIVIILSLVLAFIQFRRGEMLYMWFQIAIAVVFAGLSISVIVQLYPDLLNMRLGELFKVK